jgi:hypothetical protein
MNKHTQNRRAYGLSSGQGRETPTLLGPLERANHNHWVSNEGRDTSTLLGPLERANHNHWVSN